MNDLDLRSKKVLYHMNAITDYFSKEKLPLEMGVHVLNNLLISISIKYDLDCEIIINDLKENHEILKPLLKGE